MSSCSAIVVAKNGSKLLFATIENILLQKGLAELIIADNGNSPNVLSRLQQRSLSDPRLKIVSCRNEKNYAKACNFAIRHACGDYLLLLKSGYILSNEAINELTAALENEKHTMMTSCLTQSYDGSFTIIPRNRVVTPKTIFFDIMGIKNTRHTHKDFIPPDKAYEVATVPSACIAMRASDFKKLGGLDGEFETQEEELDLSLRVQQIGGRVICLPSVRAVELPDNHIGTASEIKRSTVARNNVRYINKFFARNHFFITLFILNLLIMLHMSLNAAANIIVELLGKGRRKLSDLRARRLLTLALGTVDVQKNNKLDKKIVLVTGATGQIGLFVIRRLIASGAAVLAVSKQDNIPYHHPSLRWIKGDLKESNFNLAGYCADIVIHCAPISLLPSVIELFHHSEVKRIIAFSSTAVFAKTLTANQFEKELILELQNAENLVEKKCSAIGLPYTILRTGAVYGIAMDHGVTKIAAIIRKFAWIFVYPPAIGRRQPVHVDDLAIAALQIIDNNITYNRFYNLSGGEMLSYRDMLERIFLLYKRRPRIINSTALPFILDIAGKISGNKYVNGEIARRMNDDQVFFNDDAVRDFAYNPRKFLNGGIKDIDGM